MGRVAGRGPAPATPPFMAHFLLMARSSIILVGACTLFICSCFKSQAFSFSFSGSLPSPLPSSPRPLFPSPSSSQALLSSPPSSTGLLLLALPPPSLTPYVPHSSSLCPRCRRISSKRSRSSSKASVPGRRARGMATCHRERGMSVVGGSWSHTSRVRDP